ncbi:hypothetical protein [Caulobacter flavus]|uniref:hypothetical protein n=1 Tax=Caulobacter flavus TaxID=1679497 RepID=UPI0015DF65E1|nr:hypothetical protein [Caulobacter flavus]
MTDTIAAHDRDAATLSLLYEQASSRLALDVGAGSGRDGAYPRANTDTDWTTRN